MKGLSRRLSGLLGLSGLIMILVVAAAPGHIAAISSVHAQAVNGSLLGTITDPNDAVLPGATVTLVDVNTNIKRSTTTNESGNYVFGNLPQGTYSIEVERDGFKKFFQTGVE